MTFIVRRVDPGYVQVTVTLYRWLRQSDLGRFILRGQAVTIAYMQSGARGQGRIMIEQREIKRIKVLIVMDADLSHPPETVSNLAQPVLRGDYDMVIGSRYIEGGKIMGWPWRRRLVSRVATAMARLLVDVRDPLAGFFAIRRELLLNVDPNACGFKIGLEALVVGGKGIRVLEIPITFKDRTRGKSKFGLRQIITYLRRLCALAMKRS